MKPSKKQRQAAAKKAATSSQQRAKVTTVIPKHHQYNGDYCAASGHEFIMKLHAKVPPTEFPLQKEPANESAGWTFHKFLEKYGFTQTTHNAPTADDAMKIIAAETAANRYPLLSFLEVGQDAQGNIVGGWHVVVAVPDGRQIRIVNPRDQKFTTNTTVETKAEIQKTLDGGGRGGAVFLDMLTYA